MTDPINYEAVVADLEARIAQLQTALQAIRAIAGMGPTGTIGASLAASSNGSIPPDAFLGMSIPEATKKLLTIQRRRLSTPDIIKMLMQGGAPEPAYNTAYAVLRRRQLQVGDIVNINGEWGLKEWTPNYKPLQSKKVEKGVVSSNPDDVVVKIDEVGVNPEDDEVEAK